MYACLSKGIMPLVSQAYDPVVFYARNKVLGGDVLKGKNQKPFQGTQEYDYLMWIDSDIMFSFSDFKKLLSWNKPIVAGVYLMADNKHYAVVKHWDKDYFVKNGSFKFETPESMGKELTKVAYTGMGFMLMKKGVMESLEYPWFRPVMHDMTDEIQDFSSEDASVCWLLQEKGHDIYVDPSVRVGHEKELVI